MSSEAPNRARPPLTADRAEYTGRKQAQNEIRILAAKLRKLRGHDLPSIPAQGAKIFMLPKDKQKARGRRT
jgi:hypothetical protein